MRFFNIPIATVLIILTTNLMFAGEISLTFDDLPCNQDESAAKQMEINQKILQALAKFKAPAIGFVNERKLYKGDEEIKKSAILKLWVDHKQPLGNHTYSHKFLSSTDAKDFQNDVVKGAAVSKKLMSDAGLKYQYFRHPYLDTGTTPEIRGVFEDFLKKEGYIIAPVTVDTDDWKFNQQLLENPQNKDKIIAKYLEHTRAKFLFFKEASLKIFGRNIRHIWLLHVNLINAYAMEYLLNLVKELGYEFITLDKALKDEVYAEPDNYYAPFGGSWLYRWDFTRGKVVDWSKDPEPDNNPFISTKSLTFNDKSRNCSIPVELYVSGESKGKSKAGIVKLPVVIINHEDSSDYRSTASNLAAQGYLVAIINHQSDEDCVEKILFVISELNKIEPNLDLEKVALTRSSKEDCISNRFAKMHPELVAKVIS